MSKALASIHCITNHLNSLAITYGMTLSSDFKMVKMKAFVQYSSEVHGQHSFKGMFACFYFCYSTQSASFVPHCFRKQKFCLSKCHSQSIKSTFAYLNITGIKGLSFQWNNETTCPDSTGILRSCFNCRNSYSTIYFNVLSSKVFDLWHHVYHELLSSKSRLHCQQEPYLPVSRMAGQLQLVCRAWCQYRLHSSLLNLIY